MAAHACADGGTIVFLAECGRPGPRRFMKWFESEDSRRWKIDCARLRGEWSDGLVVVDQDRALQRQGTTDLSEEQTRAMRMTRVTRRGSAFKSSGEATGYIMRPRRRAVRFAWPRATAWTASISRLTHKTFLSISPDYRARRNGCCACISARRAARLRVLLPALLEISEFRQPPPINLYWAMFAAGRGFGRCNSRQELGNDRSISSRVIGSRCRRVISPSITRTASFAYWSAAVT
jgi:hypothetical protein